MNFKDRYLEEANNILGWAKENPGKSLGLGATGLGTIAGGLYALHNGDGEVQSPVPHPSTPTVVSPGTNTVSTVTTPGTTNVSNNIVPGIQDDDKEFVNSWNESVAKNKYGRFHVKELSSVSDKLHITDEDPQIKLRETLIKSPEKIKAMQELKHDLENPEFEYMYRPMVRWLDDNIKHNYQPVDKDLNSNELYQHLAKLNGDNSFSQNTVSDIMDRQSPEAFFNRHKDEFYREGYDKNIKNMDKLIGFLKDDKLQAKFENIRNMK